MDGLVATATGRVMMGGVTTRFSDPAFYLIHRDGNVLETTIVVLGEDQRRPAFFVWPTVEKLRDYVRQSENDPAGFSLVSFETVEDVERHRNYYEYVVVNPKLGLRSGMEPLERLLGVARELAVED